MTPRKTSTERHARPPRASAIVSQLKKEPNELRRKMLLLGYITDRLDKKSESVYLVGGQAVETYTAGQFTTGDIDITSTDRKTTEEILARMGFKRGGMVWINETLSMAVHIVDVTPNRTEKTRLIHAGPYTVRVVGVEELIVDRLAAAKFWKSERDAEQARALLDGFAKQIDMKYLRKRAAEEKVDLPTAQTRNRWTTADLAGSGKKRATVSEMKRLLDRTRAEDT
jgi:hypothetical protein